MSADPLIEAQANRVAKALRKLFHQVAAPRPEIDDPLIENCRQAVMRGLRAKKAARLRKRKRHERTVDMFSDRD